MPIVKTDEKQLRKLRLESEGIKKKTMLLQEAIFAQMEFTRVQNNLSVREFAGLIGMGYNSYRNPQRKTISLKYFLNFCILFGLDITELVKHNSWRSEKHASIQEFAIQFCMLEEETKKEVLETINKSKYSDDKVKQRITVTLEAGIASEEPLDNIG